MIDSVILFITHKYDDFVFSLLKKLCDEVDHSKFDIYILFDNSNNQWTGDIPENCKDIYYFNKDVVSNNGFTLHKFYTSSHGLDFYGHNIDYSFMSFSIEHPEYNYIYGVEYDVYFNGNWNTLFENYLNDESDWIASNIKCFDDIPDVWKRGLWKIFLTELNKLRDECCFRSFNPIFRITKRAINYLVLLAYNGNYGFYECFVPSMLLNAGFKIEQWKETIGDDQDDKVSSMSYMGEKTRTITDSDMKPDILYHPFKHY